MSAATGRRLDGQPDRRVRDNHVSRCGGCGQWQWLDKLCDVCKLAAAPELECCGIPLRPGQACPSCYPGGADDA